MLFLAQRGDDVSSGGGRLKELRPSVPRIRYVRRPPLRDEDVRDPLDARTGQSETDPAGDLGDRQRVVQRGAEHLPPGGRQAMWRRDVVGRGEELAVELESWQHQGGQRVTLGGTGHCPPPTRASK